MPNSLSDRKKESYKIFDEIAGTYDFLNHILSMGIDIYWRNKLLANLPNNNSINALDLATGTGDVPLTLVKDERVKKITGIDMSQGMINIGIEKVKKKKLEQKIILLKGDGVHIPCADNVFDLATISFGIRNFSDPATSLMNLHRVLKTNGRLMIMEFSIPTNILVKKLYFFYFRNILPFIGNMFSKHKDAYTYLNQTVEDFPYGNDFLVLMKNAGFSDLKYTPLTFGIATLYIGDKK